MALNHTCPGAERARRAQGKMIFPGPEDRMDGTGRPLGEYPAWKAWAGAAPSFQAPEWGSDRPRAQSYAGVARARSAPVGTCALMLCTACLPWQVNAFSHQLLERWVLECCYQAPWPRSTWHLTHPFLNLILCPFHSSSHAVFTEISFPHQDEARDQRSLGCLGNVPTTGWAARAENTGCHPVDCSTWPPTRGEGPQSPPWGLWWLMFSRTRTPSGNVWKRGAFPLGFAN